MRNLLFSLIMSVTSIALAPSALAQTNCSPVPISLPFSITESISIADCLQNGYYSDRYRVNLAVGRTITIEAAAPSTTALSWLDVVIYRWIDSGPSLGWNRVIERTEYTPEKYPLKFDFQAPYTADYMFLISGGTSTGPYTFSVRYTTATPDGACTSDGNSVCLLNSRFRVSATYFNPISQQNGTFKAAKLVAGTQNPDVATFGFDSALAVEVVVRVQDAHPFGIPRFDIYYGGMTDFPYTVIVTDTQTGKRKEYQFSGGTPAGGVDRTTFAD